MTEQVAMNGMMKKYLGAVITGGPYIVAYALYNNHLGTAILMLVGIGVWIISINQLSCVVEWEASNPSYHRRKRRNPTRNALVAPARNTKDVVWWRGNVPHPWWRWRPRLILLLPTLFWTK